MSFRVVPIASGLAVAVALHTAVNARLLACPTPAGEPSPVPILVPARDEARTISACVASAAASGAVIVLDDDSSDATAALAGSAGARVVAGRALPDGWLGKPWACAQLADETDADVLVFVDADVALAPGAVAAALHAMGDADLASVFPRQEAHGLERLVQPLLTWTWLATLPLRVAERSRRPSLNAACGQFLLVRRDALERAGGFDAVRHEVLDDIALARAISTAGGRVRVIGGRHLAATRMYRSWSEICDGYGKSLWDAFGSPAGAMAVVLGSTLVWVLPAAAALRRSRAGLVGSLAGVASRLVSARVAGDRVSDTVGHPISVLVFAYLTLRSLWGHRRGTLRWKQRPIA